MATFNTRLLTPPSEEEEVQLYRDVWRSLLFQYGGFFAVTCGIFVMTDFLSFRVPDALRLPLNLGIVLLPIGLWLTFAFLQEFRYPAPRKHLLTVMVISALVANAVAFPFINEFLQVDQWLSLASAVQRIIGYTFTVGVLQEILKYFVIRFTTWNDHLRIRQDAVAYADAAAVGFAVVAGLHFVLTGSPSPDAVAARMFALLAIHVVASCIVSYGIAESRFRNASPLLLPLSLAVASFVTGVAIPVRAGLVNASIAPDALEFALPRPIFGVGFSLVLFVAGIIGVMFFYNTADRQEREMRIGQDER
jgi:RsiW-degrading membrane proteinase PrsW (M82 family)